MIMLSSDHLMSTLCPRLNVITLDLTVFFTEQSSQIDQLNEIDFRVQPEAKRLMGLKVNQDGFKPMRIMSIG